MGVPREFRWLAAASIAIASALACAAQQAGGSTSAPAPDGYRIGAGDILQVIVWKEPDASLPDAVVRTDGKLSLPLVGDVSVAGLTPEELKSLLMQKFSPYINRTVVTVSAKQINSRKIYVMGQVKKEGPIPLLRPMTVLQAINEAGGLAEWANKKKVYILRCVEGKQVKIPFNYAAVIKGEHLEQNVALLPDDSIIVP